MIDMNDPYLNNNNVINRLVEEWEKYGKIIIAYDFDNTIYDYHNKGYKYPKIINLLQECKNIGAYFIVFTSSPKERYNFIEKYLIKHNIPYDTINENIDVAQFDGRKIYYNILLDDRAGLSISYNNLKKVLDIKKNK